jgi:A/G-specific adenine glycosylase
MASARALHDRLLPWFARAARDLPWRRTRDPYAIWISEAMLQQTRVEAVVDAYERFLARFPTVAALAAADADDVLAAWSGLGYYRRARALHAAARAIVERHAGAFPRTPADARALPGVGPYTAGAVLSIAYGVRAPAVDGNVARVLARWFALADPLGSSALQRELWRRAEELLPAEDAGAGRGPGAWNQALMELGARVCAPRNPACDACPVAACCAARAAGREAELPVPARKRAPVDVRLEVALVERAGAVLLERRPPDGRMAGLWELPTREVPGPDGARAGLWPAEFRAAVRAGAPLGEVAHAITHHRIRARVRAARVAGRPVGGEHRFLPRAEAGAVGLTGMARKILARFAPDAAAPGDDAHPVLRPASRRR